MAKKIYRKSLNAENGSFDLYTVDDRYSLLKLQNKVWNEKRYLSLPVYCGSLSESIWHEYRLIKHVNYPHLALELLLGGKMQYLAECRLTVAEPGSLYIIAPGSSVSFSSFPDINAHRIVLLIKGNNLNSIISTLHLDKDCCVKVDKYEELAERFRKFGSIAGDDDDAARTNSIMTYELLLDIARMVPDKPEPAREILKIIKEKYSVNVSISSLCSKYGIGGSSLWRFFKKEFGLSPMEYLTDLRMKKALDLLRNTGLSVRTVARNCGIPDASSFCSLFKKKYGMTPGEFRRNSTAEELSAGKNGKKN